MGQQVNVYRKLKMYPGAIVEGSWNGSFDTGGTTYYVNNITGSSTADGLSWNSAVDEINTAVTLSEASRLVHPGTTTNDYIRNTIVVQGTGTGYAAVTALPGYADVIGLGADPTGNGVGIARMDGGGAAAACTVSATTRGVNLYNLQFTQTVTGAYYGLDVTAALYRSKIEHCGFTNNATGGIHIASGGSIVMDDCHTMSDQFWQGYGLVAGATGASSGNFNNCLITNSFFRGTTTAFLLWNTSCGNTYLKDCTFEGGSHGFQDLSAATAEHAVHLVNCYGYGTHSSTINEAGFEITNNYTLKAISCYANDNGTHHNYPTTTD